MELLVLIFQKQGLKSLKIPCPKNSEKYLKIQREIVAILNKFRKPTARKQQYKHYRGKLLDFSNIEIGSVKCKWKTLEKVAEIGTGSRDTNERVENGKYTFFVRSQIPRKIDSYEFDDTAIITAGDGVEVGKVFHYVQGKYALYQRAYRIVVND